MTLPSVELIVRVIACLVEGLGIRGTARVFEIDPNTVLFLGGSMDEPEIFTRSGQVHDPLSEKTCVLYI